jgi:hypothetical protein
MDEVAEAKFEQIMVDAIVRAETIDPDMDDEDFLAGLRIMQLKLNERTEQARKDAGIEELDHRGFTF